MFSSLRIPVLFYCKKSSYFALVRQKNARCLNELPGASEEMEYLIGGTFASHTIREARARDSTLSVVISPFMNFKRKTT